MYDAVFTALKEELVKEGVTGFPNNFRMICDWEFVEVDANSLYI